jgi:hypothetical protein
MRLLSWRSVVKHITLILFALATGFWVLTFVGWLITQTGFEPLNAIAAAIVSSLGGLLTLLRARNTKDNSLKRISDHISNSQDPAGGNLKARDERATLKKPTVFICYAHADAKFVDWLADRLNESGVDVWIDKWKIKLGDSITQRIHEGIGSSDFLIVVLSRTSVKSKWVREELNAASIRNIEEDKHAFILPLRTEECEIPMLLRHRKYANFKDDPVQAFQELLEVIRRR